MDNFCQISGEICDLQHKGSGNPIAPKILDLIVVFFRSGEKVSMKRAILRAFNLVVRTKVEEVSKKKIPITYNIFFYNTSSTSVIKEEGPV